jgi:hypothetical protein
VQIDFLRGSMMLTFEKAFEKYDASSADLEGGVLMTMFIIDYNTKLIIDI